MGKRNKVVKLTKRKVDYIILAKKRNDSDKNIGKDMKVGPSTVKRVWMHWLKNEKPIPIKKFGRKKITTDDESEKLIVIVHKEQKQGTRRLERIIDFKHGRYIPHNRIHEVLLKNGLAKENKNKKKRRKAWIRYERKHSLTAVHSDYPSEAGIHICYTEHTCLRPSEAQLGWIGTLEKLSKKKYV